MCFIPVETALKAGAFLANVMEAVCADAISCFTGFSGQKRIAAPPHLPWRAVPRQGKSGGSQ